MDEITILIIEDDEDIRESVKILLENEGFHVIEADNGMDGLHQISEDTDFVILDIMMPGISGIKICEQIRKISYVPILFLTAKSSENDKIIGFTAGADDYLVKPFSDEKFEEVVKRAVRSIKEYSENQLDEKYMMVQSGGSHMKVFLKDIVYAEVYNRKVIIHTRDTNIEYYGKLQELSEIAGADFFRTHRAYLVHFKYVQKYDANCVTMENGTALIAKQNYSEFVKQYLKYNQRKGKEIG